jgi:hypothetical protein
LLPKSFRPPPVKAIKPKPNRTNIVDPKVVDRFKQHQIQPGSIKMSASDPNFQFNQMDFSNKFESVQINSPQIREEIEDKTLPDEIIKSETEQEEKEIQSESSTDHMEENEAQNDQVDLYQLFVDTYADAIEELNMKPPRWRVIYETTGRLDIKFKGVKQLQVNAINMNNLKFKYLDEKNTRVDLNDRTNKFLLTYSEKKHKNPSTGIVQSSMPTTSQQANRMVCPAQSRLSDRRIKEDVQNIKQESMEVDESKATRRFTQVDEDLLKYLIDKIKMRLDNLNNNS